MVGHLVEVETHSIGESGIPLHFAHKSPQVLARPWEVFARYIVASLMAIAAGQS
jgi:hypothetical protein